MTRRPLPSPGSRRSLFPCFVGTMRRSDALPSLSPRFVSFAWRYHPVRLCSFLPQARRRLGAWSFRDWQPRASLWNGDEQGLPGSWKTLLCLCPFSAGRTNPSGHTMSRHGPRTQHDEGSTRCGNFGAEWHGLGTGCLRFVRRITPDTTQDSLLVAGQALPGGIGYPQGPTKGFQDESYISSSDRKSVV
jgi:hypothetical protein